MNSIKNECVERIIKRHVSPLKTKNLITLTNELEKWN